MKPRARARWGRAGAVALGLALASLPFVQFGFGPGDGHRHDSAPHADHRPYHGGVVRMLGDHHVELVAAPPGVRVYVSDARRRALRPERAVAHFDGVARAMHWRGGHFEAAPARGDAYRVVEVEVTLPASVVLRTAATRASLLE